MNQAITVCAFIHKDGRLFAPKRAAAKAFLPNKFELPGGHVDYGEDLTQGLRREIREEFGIDVSVGDSFYAFTYINEVKKTHSVEVVYFAAIKDRQEIKLNLEDHSEYQWLTREEAVKVWDEGDSERRAVIKGFELLQSGKIRFV